MHLWSNPHLHPPPPPPRPRIKCLNIVFDFYWDDCNTQAKFLGSEQVALWSMRKWRIGTTYWNLNLNTKGHKS